MKIRLLSIITILFLICFFQSCAVQMPVYPQVDKLPTWYDKQQDKEIDKNDRDQDKVNREQDRAIGDNLVNIFNNSQRINKVGEKVYNIDRRVGELEETQYIIGGQIRVFDTKKWTGEFFADYSTNRSTVDRAGFRFTFKMGESYTDKKLKELEKRLERLESTPRFILLNDESE